MVPARACWRCLSKQFCGHDIYAINIAHGARTCMWTLFVPSNSAAMVPHVHVDFVYSKQFCGHDIYAINISHGSRTCNFAVFCFLLGSSVAMSCYDKAYLNSYMVPAKHLDVVCTQQFCDHNEIRMNYCLHTCNFTAFPARAFGRCLRPAILRPRYIVYTQ